jgi:cytochrome b involved in lipid metabolism
VQLDSQANLDYAEGAVPDRVVSAGAGGKAGGRSVSVKDVLDKKSGDEVWVVIKGEVYK